MLLEYKCLKGDNFYDFMAEAYADFDLYFGLVNSDGCSEGRFDINRLDNEWSRHRFNNAMETVKRYLQPSYHFGFEIGWDPFVSSKEEAYNLINYAVANIQGAEPIILLYSCSHGEIMFNQLIRFNGWIIDRESELIEKMKESGIKPAFHKRNSLEIQIRAYPQDINLKKKLLNLEANRWKERLKWIE